MKKRGIALFCMILIISMPITLSLDNTLTDEYIKSGKKYTGESIAINVVEYEPTVLTSQILEESDVPVFAALKGYTLGSLIGSNVEGEPLYGDLKIDGSPKLQVKTNNKYVSGIKLLPPSSNTYSLDNMGVVKLTIKKIPKEEDVPDSIDLDMLMTIYFDVPYGIGFSEKDISLKALDENNWKESNDKAEFWDSVYVRLDSIKDKKATVEFYDTNLESLSKVTLTKGKKSSPISIDDSNVVEDKFRAELINIKDATQDHAEVEININGEKEKKTLYTGDPVSELTPNWFVQEIITTPKKDCDKGILLKNKATKEQNYICIDVVDAAQGGPVNEEDATIISDPCESYDRAIDDDITALKDLSDSDKKDSEEKLRVYCLAINQYKYIISGGDNGIFYDSATEINEWEESSSQSVADLYKKISEEIDGLELSVIKSAEAKEREYRNNLKINTAYNQERLDELDSATNELTHKGYIEEDGITVSIEVNEVIKGSGTGKVSLYVDNILHPLSLNAKIPNTAWYVSKIGTDYIEIKSGNSKEKLSLDEEMSLGGVSLKLSRVDIDQEAVIRISSGLEDFSESEFKIHIPIEKSAIKRSTPDEIDRKINKTQETIDKLQDVIDDLDNVVESWKSVCVTVFMFLTLKNSFFSGKETNLARTEVMQGEDGWTKYCEKNSGYGLTYKSYDECVYENKDAINSDIELAKDAIKDVNSLKIDGTETEIEGVDLSKIRDYEEKHGKVLENEDLRDFAYLSKLKEQCEGSSTEELVDDNGNALPSVCSDIDSEYAEKLNFLENTNAKYEWISSEMEKYTDDYLKENFPDTKSSDYADLRSGMETVLETAYDNGITRTSDCNKLKGTNSLLCGVKIEKELNVYYYVDENNNRYKIKAADLTKINNVEVSEDKVSDVVPVGNYGSCETKATRLNGPSEYLKVSSWCKQTTNELTTSVFGDPVDINKNPDQYLVTINFMGQSIKVNKKAEQAFKNVESKLKQAGIGSQYYPKFRADSHFRSLSTVSNKYDYHSYGLAIDINTESNGYWNWQPPKATGEDWDLPECVVEIFKSEGFCWGGDYSAGHKDNMHFEWLSWQENIQSSPMVTEEKSLGSLILSRLKQLFVSSSITGAATTTPKITLSSVCQDNGGCYVFEDANSRKTLFGSTYDQVYLYDYGKATDPSNLKELISSDDTIIPYGIIEDKAYIDGEWRKITVKDKKCYIPGEDGKDKEIDCTNRLDYSLETRDSYAPNAKIIYDSENRPFAVPIGNGNYVEILEYSARGSPTNYRVWNVGKDGLLETGDEVLVADFYRLQNIDTDLNKKVLEVINTVNKNSDSAYIKIGDQKFGKKTIDKKNETTTQGHCQDLWSAEDCKLLFNVCDPIMCPPSRFNLGGRWQVDNVVQTGIIGSIVLGLPLFPEDPVPICLTGVLAGLQNIQNVLKSYVDCLHSSKTQGTEVGVCEEIRSVFICEILWREALAIFNVEGGVLDWISEKITGQSTGGGEYLTFESNLNALTQSISYFTSEYATLTASTYGSRSTEEFGTEICKSAIYGKIPSLGSLVDQMTEVVVPAQFTATFSETAWSSVTEDSSTKVTEKSVYGLSKYSIFYYISAGYNGKDETTEYSVYLKHTNSKIPILPATDESCKSTTSTLKEGGYVSKSIDCVSYGGYNEICVDIDGKVECGFGKSTSSFALDYVNDMIVANEVNKNIDSEKECTSDTSRTSTLLKSATSSSSLSGILESGIQRICSVNNPRLGSDKESSWAVVGTCGKDSLGRDLGKCWINKDSITIKDLQTKSEVMDQLKETGLDISKITEGIDVKYTNDESESKFDELSSKEYKEWNEILDAILAYFDLIKYTSDVDVTAKSEIEIAKLLGNLGDLMLGSFKYGKSSTIVTTSSLEETSTGDAEDEISRIKEEYPEIYTNMVEVLPAIITVEGGREKDKTGDGGHNWGCLQIKQAYLTDVNEKFLKSDVFESDDRLNCEKSIQMYLIYIGNYMVNKGYEVNHENIARMHNGGPNGPTYSSTEAYWTKVKTAMNNNRYTNNINNWVSGL